MVNLFRILSEHFDDDRELGEYIRMLGEVPDADLQLPEGFTVSWTIGDNNVYHTKIVPEAVQKGSFAVFPEFPSLV